MSAVVAQCPYLGNSPFPGLTKGFVKAVFAAIYDVLRQAIGLSPKYIPGVARPGEVGLLTTSESYDGMFSIVKGEG